VADFERLREAVGRKGSRETFLYAFDLLEINGPDLWRVQIMTAELFVACSECRLRAKVTPSELQVSEGANSNHRQDPKNCPMLRSSLLRARQALQVSKKLGEILTIDRDALLPPHPTMHPPRLLPRRWPEPDRIRTPNAIGREPLLHYIRS
jgi:hypothetical protein